MSRQSGPPLRIGVAGCGRIAERGYLPAIARLGDVRLEAVADIDLDRCERAAPGVRPFAAVDELLAAVELDLLVVATPAASHVEVARRAASVGVRSLVEKPPALDLVEAMELARLEPLPLIGLNRRFDPGLDRIRGEAARRVGGLRLRLDLTIDPLAWGSFTASDSALLDLGPHLADLVAWIAGSPVDRVRTLRSAPRETEFEVEFEGGGGVVKASHAGGWHELVEARDGGGAVIGRFVAGGVARRLVARLRPGDARPLVGTIASQLAAVAGMQRTGRVDHRLATAADGVAVMAVLDAVGRSAAANGSWAGVVSPGVVTCLR